MRRRVTVKRLGTVLLGVTLAAAASDGQLPARGFWLIPSDYGVEARSGERFPISTDSVLAAQLTEANAVSVAGKSLLTVMGPRGKSLLLETDLLTSGRYYAVATVVPVRVTLDGPTFERYLVEHGFTRIVDLREQRGETGKSVTVQFQRYAKALLQQSGSGSLASATMGQRLELIPLVDPVRLHPGDTLRVAIRFEGRAATAVRVEAGFAGESKSPTITAASDSSGRVAIPLRRSGLWYVQCQVMRHSSGHGLDWESASASLTFSIR